MLSPFMLQLKEKNGQQKAQGEIHPKDDLMCPSQFANTAACLSYCFFGFFLMTDLLVRCCSNVTEQRGICDLALR